MNVDDYLKETETPAPEVVKDEAQPVETPPAAETRPRDEAGRFTKGEEQPETEVQATTPVAKESKQKPSEEAGLKAGITAERAKRQEAEKRTQEYERQIAEIRAELQALKQPQQAPELPDVLSDPQGYASLVHAQVQQSAQSVAINQLLNTSEMLARDKHGDEIVDEATQGFMAAVQAEPHLAQQLYSQKNPYGWLVTWHKQRQLLSEIGSDPVSYEQKLEAKLRQKIEAEYAQRTPSVIPTPPPSLAGQRSAGRMSEPAWTGPPSLNSILKR